MFALVDSNSFFASCEQIFRPDLRGKPVVVLSNNDGCIVARTKEAKALDIPDLLAYFKIRDYLEQNNVHVFSSNYELYGDISQRISTILQQYAPETEIYSIDESFLLLDGIQEDWRAYGHEMRDKIWKEVRMPVSVGIAPTKTLSKLANHIAKKSHKLNGVCVMESLQDWYGVFKKLPTHKIWGVGSRLSRRLAMMEINTVYDLVQANPKHIRKYLNVNIERTILELKGQRCYSLDNQPDAKKQIYSTRSFGEKVYDLPSLKQSVSQYASTAAEKLRKQNCLVKTVSAFIETSRYADKRGHFSATEQLLFPTNDTRDIIAAVGRILDRTYQPGYRYAKAGVGLIEIMEDNNQQLNFFNEYQTVQTKKLMSVIDQIHHKNIGRVTFASSGIDPFWKMQRSMKSPNYTTDISQIPTIRIT